MKKSRSALAALLALLLMFSSVSLVVSAQETSDEPSNLSAPTQAGIWADGNPDVESEGYNSIDVVKWFSSADKGQPVTNLGNATDHYYLLLPATADLENLTLWHGFDSDPIVNGTALANGQATSVFSGGGDFTLEVGADKLTLTVMKDTRIGSMFITTESGNMQTIHANKENKESGNILVVQNDGTVDYNNALAQIKGRGNTTWTNIEKKPYNIKLDKKASLLGMDESKKWCLLANGQDHSLIRNKLAYDLADEIGLTYAPDSQFVNLYLNNEYVGVYQVTEKIEIGKNNLVKINDLEGETEKANEQALDSYNFHDTANNSSGKQCGTIKYYDIPNDPEDITGGYLMEFDVESKYKYDEAETSGFITKLGQHVVLKGPETASKGQVEYISNFVQEMEDAIYSKTGTNSLGKHYSEYIDVDSAALMYLIQEYSVNIDCGISSCFFYKDSDVTGDGKIHASPVWDFDVSFGNLDISKDGVSMRSTDKWFASISQCYSSSAYGSKDTIFAALCKHDDFWQRVIELYNKRFAPALKILTSTEEVQGEYLKSTAAYKAMLDDSAAMNFVRWDITQNRLVKAEGKTFDSNHNYLNKFLTNRYSFLEEQLSRTEPIIDEKIEIFFDNSEVKWDKVTVNYSYGDDTKLLSFDMTNLGGGIFKYEFPEGTTNENLYVSFSYSKDQDGTTVVKCTNKEKVLNGQIFVPSNNVVDERSYEVDGVTFTEELYAGAWNDYSGQIVILGDANSDGKVTSLDALHILRSIAGLCTLTDSERKTADVNGDGKVTTIDSLYIQQHLSGIDTNLPIGTTFTIY